MSDLISRKAAIDALDDEITITGKSNAYVVMDYVKRVRRKLDDLPFAQPDTCDGCMWEDAFGYGECYRCKRAFNDMYMVKDEE